MGKSGHIGDEKPKENGQAEVSGEEHKSSEISSTHINKVSWIVKKAKKVLENFGILFGQLNKT